MKFSDLSLTERLLIARRGTAYFAQRLGELSDDDLDGQTLLPEWSRRHLVAHVAYNASALCRLMDWAATGVETPMYESVEQRCDEICRGAALGPSVLRELFSRNAVQLDQKWRHHPEPAWSAQVRTAQGRLVPASETAWMRTREVWIHAVDLDSGGRFDDFPAVVLDSLLTDIVSMWRQRDLGAGLVLAPENRVHIAVQKDSPHFTTVSGSVAAIVRWASGRGAVGIDAKGDLGEPPRWL